MEKIIKSTPNYTIFENSFEGQTLTFRRWNNEQGDVDILFDDTFAKCCGYASAGDMIVRTIGEQGMQQIIDSWGSRPEWVKVMDDGSICFVGEIYGCA